MGKIRILSEEVANRIAAGEVVERPVSVVKELVENAIDAAADKIIVKIENGGKSLIQITDNGIGMAEDDALQSFERHATSKIRTVTDIFHISSLGFRGEALPSIAAVSKLTLITRFKEDELASKIEFDSGHLRDFSKTAGNPGTTISVKRLFANVPARKKFLKSAQVEYRHIANYLHYQSILYPAIQFIFISEGKEKLNYPQAKNRKTRMKAVFGEKFFRRDFLEVQAENPQIKLEGFISGLEEENEGFADFRYLYVNGRYIKDRIVFHSIRSAYDPFVKKLRIYQKGKIPPFVLFLELDPSKVDFNVHPAKLEIRFRDPGFVHGFVKNAINQKLLEYEDAKYHQIKDKLRAQNYQGAASQLERKIFTNRTDQRRFSDIKKEMNEIYQPDIFKEKERSTTQSDILLQQKKILLRPEEDVINPWQLHQSYIFVQTEDGLIVIDQHAAHERIIFEKILHRIHGAPPQTQKLLFPIVIDLPPYLSNSVPELIGENIKIFQKIGFSIKTFSGDSIVIEEIPIELEDWDGGEIFINIIKQLQLEFEETEDFRDSLAKSVACKAAIKAGRKMNKKEMLALINDLFACEVPYYCPHGRPLIIKMQLSDFEQKFKRNQ